MLAILNYHNIAAVPMGMKMPQLYVSPEQFARQLWWLRRVGLVGVSLSEGMRRLNTGDAAGCVALTFDDGYADNMSSAAPMLREYGFGATCFVVSDWVGSYNAWDSEQLGGRKPLMSRADIDGWLGLGFEIGSHTCSHPDLTALSQEAAMEELANSYASLSRITGAPVTTFCYPYGRCNSGLARSAYQAGYRIAVTTRRGRAHPKDDKMLLPRVSVDGRKGLFKFLCKAATAYCDLGFHGGSALDH